MNIKLDERLKEYMEGKGYKNTDGYAKVRIG